MSKNANDLSASGSVERFSRPRPSSPAVVGVDLQFDTPLRAIDLNGLLLPAEPQVFSLLGRKQCASGNNNSHCKSPHSRAKFYIPRTGGYAGAARRSRGATLEIKPFFRHHGNRPINPHQTARRCDQAGRPAALSFAALAGNAIKRRRT